MAQTNLLTAIVKSFYSKKLYQETAQSWLGRSFLYLLILLCIYCAVLASITTFRVNAAIHMFAQKIATIDLPIINFKEGIASTKVTTPYYIKDSASGKTMIIIDTGNKIRNFDKSTAIVLVQKNSIFFRDDQTNKISQYNYPKNMPSDIGPKQIQNLIQHSIKWIVFFTFIAILLLGIIITYIICIILTLVYALIGKLFCLILKRSIPYESLMSLTIISITPTVIISAIALIFNFSFPFALAFYLLLPLVYLFFTIKANPKSEIIITE